MSLRSGGIYQYLHQEEEAGHSNEKNMLSLYRNTSKYNLYTDEIS